MIEVNEAVRQMSEAEGIGFGCREIRGRLDAYVSRELDPVSDRRVRDHLDVCPTCSRLCEDIERVRGVLRRAVHHDATPDSLRESILRRIRGD